MRDVGDVAELHEETLAQRRHAHTIPDPTRPLQLRFLRSSVARGCSIERLGGRTAELRKSIPQRASDELLQRLTGDGERTRIEPPQPPFAVEQKGRIDERVDQLRVRK